MDAHILATQIKSLCKLVSVIKEKWFHGYKNCYRGRRYVFILHSANKRISMDSMQKVV